MAYKLIEYYNENLALSAIAKKEGISNATLRRNYDKVGDIYLAVKIAKEKSRTKIEYKGEQLTLSEIAKREKIQYKSLKKYYEQSGNIYEAVKRCLEQLMKRRDVYEDVTANIANLKGKIEYKGEQLSLVTISSKEKIDFIQLKNCYIKTGNIYKAVFAVKRKTLQSKSVKIKDSKVTLYDMALIIGIKYSTLVNLLQKGMSIEEIKERYVKKDNKRTVETQILLKYCMKNKLSYSYVYRAMHTYGKTLEEAKKSYQANGNNIPIEWIYEKYAALLKHLKTNNNIDTPTIIEYMMKEKVSIEEAIEKYIVTKKASQRRLCAEWMEEVYMIMTAEELEKEQEILKATFGISKNEENCVSESVAEIQKIKRKLESFKIHSTKGAR